MLDGFAGIGGWKDGMTGGGTSMTLILETPIAFMFSNSICACII